MASDSSTARSLAPADGERSTSIDFPFALWRRRTAGVGILALCTLAAFGTIGGDQLLAAVAFVGLAVATLLAWAELVQARQHRRSDVTPHSTIDRPRSRLVGDGDSRSSRWAPLLALGTVTAVAVGAVQTWYTPGTAIAVGDVAPPNGTAWLGQLFSTWTWSGSDLGRPGSLQVLLPWAAVLSTVHSLGASSALAQRLWYTALFAGAALGALWLLRLLHASWMAATIGSLLFLFNPFVLSTVGANPVFLAALVLVVVEPAIVLSVCSGRWRCRSGAVALVATVPLLGYAYANPPLLLAVAAATLAGVVVSAIWFGRPARRRAGGLLALGLPLGFLASLYWLVPSVEQLHFDAINQLSSLASWTWTESRSTLANAFWLNTSWAWRYKIYLPFTQNYDILPLSLLRYAFPIIAFAALSFRYGTPPRSSRRLALVASGATGSLLVILVSTGTRLPGSVLFDPLYRLPYGWLLQQPGRFLILAGVGYAVMAVVTIDTWMARLDHAVRSARAWSTRSQLATKFGVAVLVVGVAALAPGYPLVFGAIAPGPRPGQMPSTHVRVPRYWTALAGYLNAPSTPPGNLLVLPPDPFYQMPYTWGYYGTDGFITDMIRRNVVDPAGQGYGAAGQELLTAVDQVATSLLAGDDTAANRILQSMATPDVLVRGDINTRYRGFAVDSPQALAAALRADPAVELVHRSGPLSVFRLRQNADVLLGVQHNVRYATTESRAPNLLTLAALPAGTALVDHAPIPGVPAVVQVPNEWSWKLHGTDLREATSLPPRRSYSVTQLGERGMLTREIPIPAGTSTTVGATRVTLRTTHTGPVATLLTRVGRNELSDGNFDSGQWQHEVGNCDDAPAGPRPDVSAQLVSAPPGNGGQALMLSANFEIACESKAIAWHGGSVLLTLSARDVSGNGPAICLWEVGPNRCATLPALDASKRWHIYQELVTPAARTTGLALFLYAYGGGGTRTADAYAAISIRPAPRVAPLAFVATSTHAADHPPVLTTADSTYTSLWTVRGQARHVLVNGMTNGWLTQTPRNLNPHDTASSIFAAGYILAVVGGFGTLVLGASMASGVLPAWRRRRRSTRARAAGVDETTQRGRNAS